MTFGKALHDLDVDLQVETSEVHISDFDYDTISWMLRYMYGCLELSPQNLSHAKVTFASAAGKCAAAAAVTAKAEAAAVAMLWPHLQVLLLLLLLLLQNLLLCSCCYCHNMTAPAVAAATIETAATAAADTCGHFLHCVLMLWCVLNQPTNQPINRSIDQSIIQIINFTHGGMWLAYSWWHVAGRCWSCSRLQTSMMYQAWSRSVCRSSGRSLALLMLPLCSR